MMIFRFNALLSVSVTLCLFFSLAGLQAQTVSLTEGCSPLEVNFTPPAGVASYYWDFDNGATSTLSNPVNTYIEAGVYTVSFSLSAGSPVLGTVTITVYDKPDLEIASDIHSGCRPLLVNFNDQTELPEGITINNYEWVFGDGGTTSGTDMPTHLYTSSGNFDVSLAIETNLISCNTTEIFPALIKVSSVDNVGFVTIPNPPRACEPPLQVSFINFTPANNLTLDWDFGNGNTFTGSTPPPQLYTENGVFQATLTARDTNNCTNSFTLPVTIGRSSASFNIPDTVCIMDSIFIENTSDLGGYFWDFSEGASIDTTSIKNPALNFTQYGLVNINLTVTPPDSICAGDTTITVFVDEADASFTSDPSFSCSNPLIVDYTPLSPLTSEWLWIFHDVEFSIEQFPRDTLSYIDTTLYGEKGPKFFFTTLIAYNASGCQDTVSLADTIFQPNAWFMPDVIDGCAPLTVMFADSSSSREPITRWTYIFGDGSSQTLASYDDPIAHTFAEPGSYEVQLYIENEGGCVDTSYVITIEVGEPIPIDFTADQTEVCPGEQVTFTSLTSDPRIDAWHFATEGDRSTHCYLTPEMQWVFNSETGPQDVTMSVVYNGCLSTLTKENFINIKGPIAKIDHELDCAQPNDFIFRDSSLSATSIQWDFGDNQTSTQLNPIHTYAQTGNYTVILIAENDTSGCVASRDTALIYVRNPEAIFEAPINGCKGDVFELNGAASVDVNADCWKGYEWFFTKNSRPITTQDTSVVVRFATAGPDTISLVVEDINGCKDTTSHIINIHGVDATFNASTNYICLEAENPVVFTDSTQADTTIVSWLWHFGDGGTSALQNPSHLFQGSAASYIITLEATDILGCKGVVLDSISVYEPVSQLVSLPQIPNVCLGQAITFSATDYTEAGSFLLYDWDFGNGAQSDEQTNEVVYAGAGTYLVQLNYEEASSGCGGSLSQLVNIQNYPIADFSSSVDSLPIVCYPANIFFTDQSESSNNLSYFWNFGNGQTGFTTNPAASFDKGTFEVQLIVSTSYGCRDTISRELTLVGPEGDFSIAPDRICVGESVLLSLQDTVDVSTYTWNFGDGQQEDNVNPVMHAYNFVPPSGQTVITLILEGTNGACTFAVEKPVDIIDVSADFLINNGLDSAFCIGNLQFTNTSTGANVWQWDFDNGNNSQDPDPVINFESGTYDIQLAVENSTLGCRDTLIRQITLYDNPPIDILPDTLCFGDTIQLQLQTLLEDAIYFWEPSSLVTDNTVAAPLAFPVTSTEFSVSVTDANGCSGTDSQVIDVIRPFPEIPSDTTICKGDTLFINLPNDDNFYQFAWTPAPPPFSPEDDQLYQLLVTDVLGCREDIFDLNLAIVTDYFEIPNVFTPNGDDINDVFKVYSEIDQDREDLMQILDFKVYNRWGGVVFEGSGPNAAWDGRYKGEPAPSEVYIYAISIFFPKNGRSFLETGDVTLVR